MRPFFSYYGGKWRDAPRNYPPPIHGAIIEPFAGSAGYALRYHDRDVTLFDVDEAVIGVWQYLIRATSAEILSLPDVGAGSVDDLDIHQEARWLIGFWLNRGAATPRKTPSSWMRSGIRPGSFWGQRVRQRIASQVDGIRHWRASLCDWRHAPNCAATWFVDPPYQRAGRHYRHGSAGIDYTELAAWCRTRRGQVIVCEDASADWLPFEPIRTVKTTRKNHRSNEAVWVSPLPMQAEQVCIDLDRQHVGSVLRLG